MASGERVLPGNTSLKSLPTPTHPPRRKRHWPQGGLTPTCFLCSCFSGFGLGLARGSSLPGIMSHTHHSALIVRNSPTPSLPPATPAAVRVLEVCMAPRPAGRLHRLHLQERMWGKCRVPGRLQNPPPAWAPGPAYRTGAPAEPVAHWTAVPGSGLRDRFSPVPLALLSYQCDSAFTDKEDREEEDWKRPWPMARDLLPVRPAQVSLFPTTCISSQLLGQLSQRPCPGKPDRAPSSLEGK